MRTDVLWPAGALALAGEAVVHIQQYFALFHEVRWIGPLFLANAVALASLIVSYGEGLFGWQEAGFRPIVELTVSRPLEPSLLRG